MVVPVVHSLIEQVHLDVNRCLWSILVDGATCAFVPWCVRFDLALGACSSEYLTAADPRGLVCLREGHDRAEVKGHFQDGVGDDFRGLLHVALDGHVAGQAVGVGEGHRFDSDGVIVLGVCDVLTMALVFTA